MAIEDYKTPVRNPKGFSELSTAGKIGVGAAVAVSVPLWLLYKAGKFAYDGVKAAQATYSEYQETKALAAQMKELEIRPVKDEEIRQLFDEAVQSAQTELDVTAMELNYVAEGYTPQFRALLERGVTLKTLYGIGEESSPKRRNQVTNATADKLRKKFGGYPNFHIQRTDSHSKVFICDNKFVVVSSYNVLSKDGQTYDWSETGICTNSPNVLSGFRQDYFNF